MIKIVIFDLDGTLLNTLEDLADSTNFALKKFNYPTRTIKEVREFVGNGVVKLFERANVTDKKCIEIFKQHYAKNMYNKTAPYEGIETVLSELKSKGIKIAVVSNKFDLAVKNLCKKYFGNLIDFASGENESKGIRRKPAPDTIFSTLKHFGLSTEDAIYIGDSEVDIQTAKNSNIPCISVTWGFKTRDFLLENGAENIVENPKEILKYL